MTLHFFFFLRNGFTSKWMPTIKRDFFTDMMRSKIRLIELYRSQEHRDPCSCVTHFFFGKIVSWSLGEIPGCDVKRWKREVKRSHLPQACPWLPNLHAGFDEQISFSIDQSITDQYCTTEHDSPYEIGSREGRRRVVLEEIEIVTQYECIQFENNQWT